MRFVVHLGNLTPNLALKRTRPPTAAFSHTLPSLGGPAR
jgi:hypothetical protein